MRLHADYLHEEYGALDSDYMFMTPWSRPRGRPLGNPVVTDLYAWLTRHRGDRDPHMIRHT